MEVSKRKHDPINHPAHYNLHPSGIEAITICEHFDFLVGNVIKYVWRAGLKPLNNTDAKRRGIDDARVVDLRKAAWYLNREIARLTKVTKNRR